MPYDISVELWTYASLKLKRVSPELWRAQLWRGPTEENAYAAFEALLRLGVPPEGLQPGDLLDDEEILRFGSDEDHIDILASIGKMPFDQVWRNRMETIVEAISVPFISKADLIENKRQTGRLRDLADVEELELIPERLVD